MTVRLVVGMIVSLSLDLPIDRSTDGQHTVKKNVIIITTKISSLMETNNIMLNVQNLTSDAQVMIY